MPGMRNPIIVALDVPNASQALTLAREVAGSVGAFKVGSELFTSVGPDFVRQLRQTGASIFLDLKFHDIPNTVAKAVASAVNLNVQMLTIHTCGGLEMMRAAKESALKTAGALGQEPPLILGVTVLTSMNGAALEQVGAGTDVGTQVERLAALAVEAGLGGLVCSPLEIQRLRRFLPATTRLVTPGIRLGSEQADDQKRTLSAREAMDAGADWLVIGRPIYAAPDPAGAARRILESLAS